MGKSEEIDRGKSALKTGLFDNLTVQDAVTIIALYAAQIDPEDCSVDLNRIKQVLNRNSLFNEKPSDTLTRINKFVNSMELVKSSDAVQAAAKVLIPELRQMAFTLAIKTGASVQASRIESVKTLKSLASKLSIDAKIVKKTTDPMIKNFFDEINDQGIFALAHESKENLAVITNWAQGIFDRYKAVLEMHSTKIKNIAELPASKQEVKMAIKILLTAYVLKETDEMVESLKDGYIGIGAFQYIDLEDKEKIFHEVEKMEQESEPDYASVFPEYHKYMEVIISEQNALLDDVNNFINDLKELPKES